MKPSSHNDAPARSMVHPARFWLYFRKTLPNGILDISRSKRPRMIARPPTLAPQPTSPLAPSPVSAPEADLSQAPQVDGENVSLALPRVRPSRALRIFGLLGLAVVILLTLVLSVLSYSGADGLVIALFNRVRLIVTLASAAALVGLLAVTLTRRRSR